MESTAQLQAEIESLKSRLKVQEEKIISLEKLNICSIEQLKLRQKEKFGVS